MRVISEGIVDGVIQDRYGQLGTSFDENGIPSRSLPFEILEAPAEAKSFAIVLVDQDAVPVTRGFPWIHWTACNITRQKVLEDESRRHPDFVQGLNSWPSIQGGELPEADCCRYGGMSPPDRPHVYELHVYALDIFLPLWEGFWVNELYHAMSGHVLEECVLKGTYPKTGQDGISPNIPQSND